tara:strand:+ start:509 stop:1147 length:639 start_codon:yes stop_codon:yes gene_type:complete
MIVRLFFKLLCIILITKNGFSVDHVNHYILEPALVFQQATISGYKITNQIDMNSAGVSIRGGYRLKMANHLFLTPVLYYNLMNSNLIQGQNSISLEPVDVLLLSNPYGVLLRFGGPIIASLNVELILGTETNTYRIPSDVQQFSVYNIQNPFQNKSIFYGIRLKNQEKQPSIFFDIQYGVEIITQRTTFQPFQSLNENWQIQTTAINIFLYF